MATYQLWPRASSVESVTHVSRGPTPTRGVASSWTLRPASMGTSPRSPSTRVASWSLVVVSSPVASLATRYTRVVDTERHRRPTERELEVLVLLLEVLVLVLERIRPPTPAPATMILTPGTPEENT